MSDRVTFSIKRTHVWAIGGLVVGFALGIAARAWSPGAGRGDLATTTSDAPSSAAFAPAIAQIDVAGRPFKGGADARVTVVEFMDYQCPFCRRHFDSTLTPLLNQYGSRIKYVVMNYPIPDLHPGAMPYAEAAECARDQGRFWQMHDRLIHAEAWDAASLRKHAAAAGLDASRFGTCMNDGAMRNLVQQQMATGGSLGIAGTPVFFINGLKLEGAAPLAVFTQMIDQALAVSSQ